METEDDITISESEKFENWKDQASNMVKDFRTTIMADVQELMNENMKELIKEVVVNIRHNIIVTMKTQITNNTTNLTPTTTPETITQSPHPIPPPSRRIKQHHRRNIHRKNSK